MPYFMCQGNYDCCGERCEECCRYMDDCDGMEPTEDEEEGE